MKITSHAGFKRVIIDPGECHASRDNLIISTLLGSCVSACLWDPVNRVVGMNHFLLAHKRYQSGAGVIATEAGRYGIHSMEMMINSMLKLGAKRQHLKAKAFGGGHVMPGLRQQQKDNFLAVGDVNSRFIREFLESEKIPLLKEHLGGSIGRVIHFHSEDFSVYMKRIEYAAQERVLQQEHLYWEQQIKRQKLQEAQSSAQYW